MSKRIEDLENRSRRNNLIVRGVEEVTPENEGILPGSVNHEVLAGLLKVIKKILLKEFTNLENIHVV